MSAAIANSKIADSFGKAVTPPALASRSWFKRLGLHAALGLLLVCINFPNYLRKVIEENFAELETQALLLASVNAVQAMLQPVIGKDPSAFSEFAMTFAFWLIWIWLIFSILVSIRQHNARWIVFALGGLIAGYFTLHLLAWIAVILVVIFGATLFAVGWVGTAIGGAFGFVSDHVVFLALVGGAIVIIVFRNAIPTIWDWLLSRALLYWKKAAAATFGIAVLILLVPFVWQWIVLPIWNWIISPIFGAIGWLLSWLLTIIFVILLTIAAVALVPFGLALLGTLFIAQLEAGWHAGRHARFALVTGFAIGSLLTLIVLVSLSSQGAVDSLNGAWARSLFSSDPRGSSVAMPIELFTFFLPDSVANFSNLYLDELSAPAFDSLILLTVLLMATVSLGERLLKPKGAAEPDISPMFVFLEYGKMIGGLFVGLVVIFAQGMAGEGIESSDGIDLSI